MKIAHTNDLHYRNSLIPIIDGVFEAMAATNPDVITIAGDMTGDHPEAVKMIFSLLREHWEGPVVACLGNHDYWVHDPQIKDQAYMVAEFEAQIQKASRAAADYNVHLLEEHGVWSSPLHYGICILGHGGWYYRGHRSSNDYNWLPTNYEGLPINEYMNRRAEASVRGQIASLTDEDWTRIGMVHMPVNHMTYGEYSHGGNHVIGDLLASAGVKKTLNGHMHHTEWNGPNRYQAGSDYGNPQFITLEVI